jgi:hypothetical protein
MRVHGMYRLMAALIGWTVLGCGDGQVSFPVRSDEEFVATLSGGNEVPPVTTSATGSVEVAVVLDTFLVYNLTVAAIDSPTTAHIHPGAAGVGGEADTLLIVLANSNTRRAGLTGLLNNAQVKPSQLTRSDIAGYGSTARARFDSLVSLMRAGNVYVHVHTRANRSGEIRGQIRLR